MLEQIPSDATKPMNLLYKRGTDLLHQIGEQKQKAQKHHAGDFHIKLAIHILQATEQLIQSPSDSNNIRRYEQLMQLNQHGRSSISKKITGIMMAVLGAALAVASTILGITTAGFLFAGIGVGSVLVASGLGLFASGMQKGIAKNMEQINTQATVIHQTR